MRAVRRRRDIRVRGFDRLVQRTAVHAGMLAHDREQEGCKDRMRAALDSRASHDPYHRPNLRDDATREAGPIAWSGTSLTL
jgi:hypothetical protein